MTVLIWRNRVTDGQLAAKLPVVLLAGVGVALVLEFLWRVTSGERPPTADGRPRPDLTGDNGQRTTASSGGRRSVVGGRPLAALAVLALVAALGYRAWATRPFILSVTRDDSSQAIVEAVDRVVADPARPATVLVPWGTDYWTLTYEQRFGGRLAGLNLVDHNARPQDIIDRGRRLLLPDQTLRIFPLSTFEERLGPLYLASAAPGVVEISPSPIITETALVTSSSIIPTDFDLENGARVRGYRLDWADEATLLLTLYWGPTGRWNSTSARPSIW